MSEGRFDEITTALAADMKPARFRHTLGVLHSATVLAVLHNAPVERIQLAALLHDCAKGMDREQLLACIRDQGLAAQEEDLAIPAILHGPVGASVARHRFGVEDEEVLEAIHFHPTGKKDPSATLQILMAADFTEPTRDYPGVEELRDAVRHDLRSGLHQILRHKAQHLRDSGRPVHSRTSEMIASLEA